MADYQRDEFPEQLEESPRQGTDKLFYSIQLILAIVMLVACGILLLIEKFLYFGMCIVLGSAVLWILSTLWLSNQKYPRIAQIILSLTINSTLILLPLFALLTSLKTDGYIHTNLAVLLIPLFVWQVFILSFLIFIIPGFYDTDSAKWVWVLMIYYFSAILTEIAILIILSLQTQVSWFMASGFLLIALSFHLIVVLSGCKLSMLWPILIILALLNAVTLLTFNFDGYNYHKNYILIPIFCVCIIHTIKQI